MIHKILLIALLAICTSVSAQDADDATPVSEVNINNINELTSIKRDGDVLSISWSPDGEQLAAVVHYSDEQVVEIWDLDDPATLNLALSIKPDNVSDIHWLPDSKTIVTTAIGTLVYVAAWDTTTGQLNETFLDSSMIIENCCDPPVSPIVGWNNDYTIAATIEDAHAIEITDIGLFEFRFPESLLSGTYTEEPEFGSISLALWSPQDNYIAVVHADGTPSYKLHIVDAVSLESLLMAYGPDYWICDMAWSPDETTLAVASEWLSAGSGTHSTNVRFYTLSEIVNYGGETILSQDSLSLHGWCQSALAWSPDSHIIAIGSPTGFRFYETSEFMELSYVERANIVRLSWHPSRNIVASSNAAGEIHLWGLELDE